MSAPMHFGPPLRLDPLPNPPALAGEGRVGAKLTEAV